MLTKFISGCRIKKIEKNRLISVRLWNFKDGQKSIYSKETIVCILRIRGAPFRQKLGMILENKVVQKLKLEKNVFLQKMVS